jgi:hypothetical protein
VGFGGAELAAHRLAGAAQSGHHRSDRDRQNFSHLTTSEAFNNAEQQYRSMFELQAVERLRNCHRVIESRRNRADAGREWEQVGNSPEFTPLRVKGIEKNTEKPSPGIGPRLELVKVFPGEKKTILHEIFGGRGVGRKSPRDTEQAPGMAHRNAFELVYLPGHGRKKLPERSGGRGISHAPADFNRLPGTDQVLV